MKNQNELANIFFNYALTLLTASVVTAALVLLIRVPLNMDEFIHYHNLACQQAEGNKLNTGREGCQKYDLAIGGQFFSLRAYTYSGASPSILYAPIFYIAKTPYSARALGFFVLLLVSFIFYRFWGIEKRIALLATFSFFPLVFQTIVDTGPVGFQVFAIAILPILLTHKLKRVNLVISSVVLFLSIFHKAFFVPLIPIAAGLTLIYAWRNSSFLSALKLSFVSWSKCLLIVATPLAILFMAKDRDGKTWWSVLQDVSKTDRSDLKTFVLNRFDSVKFFFANFKDFTHRVYFKDWDGASYTGLFWVILFLTILILIFVSKSQRNTVFKLLALTAIAFTVLTFFTNASSGHHYVFAFLPILYVLVISLNSFLNYAKTTISLVVALVLVLGLAIQSLATTHLVLKKDANFESDPTADWVFNTLSNPELAKNHLYVVTSWGLYYRLALYGPTTEAVIYMQPFDSDVEVEKLKQLVAETKREPIFVGQSSLASNGFCKKVFKGEYAWSSAGGRPYSWGIWAPVNSNAIIREIAGENP